MSSESGYLQLVEAGSALTGTEIFDCGATPTAEHVAEFLRTNHDTLLRAESVLQHPCAITLQYNEEFFTKHMQGFMARRNLARAFALQLNAAMDSGAHREGIKFGLLILDLANGCRRGGLVTDDLIARAMEGVAIPHLRRHRQQFSATDATLANQLLQREDQREAFEAIHMRDQEWSLAVYGPQEPESMFPDKDPSGEPLDEMMSAMREFAISFAKMSPEVQFAFYLEGYNQQLALLRLLAIECALNAFRLQHQQYPESLAALAPDFINVVPTDPYTQVSFLYRKTGTTFVLYSPGPRGVDHGGKFDNFLSVSMGQADLCLDVHDYTMNCCAIAPPRPTWWGRVTKFCGRLVGRRAAG